jgi:DNA (cytosine-5)-methyltransferase 1
MAQVDYANILNEAWDQHLAPREKNAPTVISTFAGCGGSSLGYSMAGFRELLAVEWDSHAAETFRRNFPEVPLFHGDIAKLSVEMCLEMTGLAPGELDVFDGSPPCQGFSVAGKQDMSDSRNQLFRQYVRLLRGLQPKVFVMENVAGMVQGKMKLIFVEILRELKASGYKVSAGILNAMHFNVPQRRRRVIFIGIREDLAMEPSHPKAESAPITVAEALRATAFEKDAPTSPRLEAVVPYIKQGENAKSVPIAVLKEHYPSTVNKIRRGEFTGRVRLQRMVSRKPHPTITKIFSTFGSESHLHPTENRYLSSGELKRCGGVPDQFIITGSYRQIHARIGNSVPPLFMRGIARHVRQYLR